MTGTNHKPKTMNKLDRNFFNKKRSKELEESWDKYTREELEEIERKKKENNVE